VEGRCDWDDDETLQPGLNILKDDGKKVVKPGETLVYTVTGHNTGPGTSYGTIIRDLIPPNTVFVSASDGGLYDATTRVVTWPAIDRFAAGARVDHTVTVTVNDDVEPLSTVVNYAQIFDRDMPDPGTPGPDNCEKPLCAVDIDRTPAASGAGGGGANTGIAGTPIPWWMLWAFLLFDAAVLAGWLVWRRRHGGTPDSEPASGPDGQPDSTPDGSPDSQPDSTPDSSQTTPDSENIVTEPATQPPTDPGGGSRQADSPEGTTHNPEGEN